MKYKTSDLLIRPSEGEGETTDTDMLIIARADALGGDFSIMQGTVGPRKLIPPHTHEHEDQAVFVISGELEFEVGGDDGLRFTAKAGDYVLKPRHVQHCFWNLSETETVRYIELSGRDGFEKFVDLAGEGALKWSVKGKRELGVTWQFLRFPKLMVKHGLNGFAAAKYGELKDE